MDLTPENEQKINEVLGYLLDSVQKAGEVAADQLPLVAQEIVAWGFWSNLVTLCVLAVLWTAPIALGLTLRKAFTDLMPGKVQYPWHKEGEQVNGLDPRHQRFVQNLVACIILGAITFVLTAALPPQIGIARDFVKTIVAPRLYVIDWLRGQ